MRFSLTFFFHFHSSKPYFFGLVKCSWLLNKSLTNKPPKWLNLKKKKKAADKAEMKKKHATQMAEFRTIVLKQNIQPTLITTPVFQVAFPTFPFTFTT